jgi:hypothetical protein
LNLAEYVCSSGKTPPNRRDFTSPGAKRDIPDPLWTRIGEKAIDIYGRRSFTR